MSDRLSTCNHACRLRFAGFTRRKLPERRAVSEVTIEELATVIGTLTDLMQEVADLGQRMDALVKTADDQPRPQAERHAPPGP